MTDGHRRPSMPFSIRFLGTGNARSKPPYNYNTNAILSVGIRTYLIDCGLLAPLAMFDMGLRPSSVSGVFITHLHGDHVGGLEELLFANHFGDTPRRPDLYIPCGLMGSTGAPAGYDLWENCLRASMGSSVRTPDGLYRDLKLGDYAVVHSLYPGRPFDIGGLPCEIFEVSHVPGRPAYGIILDDRVAFTGDCTFSKKTIEWLLDRGIGTIFHDVTFEPGPVGQVHATYAKFAASIPPETARRIIFMHYGDDIGDGDIARAMNRGFRFADRDTVYNF